MQPAPSTVLATSPPEIFQRLSAFILTASRQATDATRLPSRDLESQHVSPHIRLRTGIERARASSDT